MSVSDEDKRRELNVAMVAAIATMTQTNKAGDAAAKNAAKAAYDAAHAAYWSFEAYLKHAAPGASERDTIEMRALDPQVADELARALPNVLYLHNDHLPASIAAARIFKYLGASGELYRRGTAVVELDTDCRMAVLSPTAFRSRLNKKGRKVLAFKKTQTNELFATDKHCGEDAAKVLLSASEVDLLPEIKLVASVPLLVEMNGKLVLTKPGYNADSGVLVTGNIPVWDVAITEAASALADLLRDFQFATNGDKARGLAGLIGPALRMGGLLPGNALVDVTEADQSQTGKGIKHQVTHAIYSEQSYPIAQRAGGVGSFDESLSQAIMSGAPFLVADNLRGVVNSTMWEHAITPITNDGRVAVRVPHRGEVMIETCRTTFQATSNGFSSTKDLANRLLVTRLIRQPSGYQFTAWPEGGLLQRIRRHCCYYLSCVHAVVRYWHAAGKPKLPTDHSFRDWVGTLDWIVRNVWGTTALLDGHADAAARIANQSLSWLRQVAFAVLQEGRGGMELRASDIRQICEVAGLMPEGVRPGYDDNHAERAIGTVLANCFRSDSRVNVDGIQVMRVERLDKRPAQHGVRPAKFYTFTR